MIQTLKVCFTIANSEEITAEHSLSKKKKVAFLQDYSFFSSTYIKTQALLRPWKHRIPSTCVNPDSNTETGSSKKVKYAGTNVTTAQSSADNTAKNWLIYSTQIKWFHRQD